MARSKADARPTRDNTTRSGIQLSTTRIPRQSILSSLQTPDTVDASQRRRSIASTTTPPRQIGEKGVTRTFYGQAIPKNRFHILVKKYRKHGVFAPVTSRELQGLTGLSLKERAVYIGFRKEGETFSRSKLTEKDPGFLYLCIPLMLAGGDLSPRSSLNLLSNVAILVHKSPRMLELYESIDKETPEDVPEELDNQKKNERTPPLYESNPDNEEDPDRPKGTADEQMTAYGIRNRDVESILKPLKEVENKTFQAVDDSTIIAAKQRIMSEGNSSSTRTRLKLVTLVHLH
ncbi:hypothetical protein BKA58DRAFT_415711 [Alternaria rosae]|uniref:uncharacterized protein n=1 Tax=Alternaria rosae TaxID=1187941 RepID=UPI001E8E952D|nr:uncharacterized protein BKA58DRAFT_415711 [Alternaria rosae]KAH6881526.1 hypothetical protein BKA58DRAFT_415711 [Alternaria rosae]